MQQILFTSFYGKYIYWNDSVATATTRLFSNHHDEILHDLVLFWLLIFLITKEM